MLKQAEDDWGRELPLPLTSNLLLKQLNVSDRIAVERQLELQHVTVGTVLFDVGAPVQYAYFPLDAIISLEHAGHIEVAIAGREGMSGWTALAGHSHSPYRAVACCRDGLVLRVAVDSLVALMATSAKLHSTLSQYVVITTVQMAEGVGAHSHHRLGAAIARWLLMRHDRVGGDWIHAHHLEIAANLGVRRASVTDCLHVMEGEMHIRCRRGRILIRNRNGLEDRAQGVYGAAESLYRSSIGEFGKAQARATRAELVECTAAA